MFKPTPQLQRQLRRLKLTTKQANKGSGYYKGNRVGSMGSHTKHGGYIIDYKKVRTYAVPSLKDFKLTPFVNNQIDKPKGEYGEYKLGPMDGKLYLKNWKENGKELHTSESENLQNMGAQRKQSKIL